MGGVTGDSVLDRPDPLSARQAWALTDAELATHLDEVFAAEQTLAAQRLALIAQIDAREMAVRDGATSTAAWLRQRLRIDAGPAKQMVRLAQALETALPTTAQALAEARVNVAQAEVIGRAMSELPAGVGPKLRTDAEEALVEFAAQFCPAQLTRLGARVLEHVAPEVAERHEREQLERAEERAWRDRTFKLSPDGPGRVRLSGWLDTESAATVSAAVESLCSPASSPTTNDHPSGGDRNGGDRNGGGPNGGGPNGGGPNGGGPNGGGPNGRGPNGGDLSDDDRSDDDRSPGQRRADALVHLCRMALAGGDLPTRGGERPQVLVTMAYEPWRDKTVAAVGRLDNGQRVAPSTLRRMACDADLIPVVLGAGGQPLDVGRRHRLFTGAVRKALMVRDGGCAFPCCDRPATWCDGHHLVSWLDGGVTSVDNGVLLCRRHHRLIHEGHWRVRLGSDGLPEFIPPSYMDPERKPRRNQYHRRT